MGLVHSSVASDIVGLVMDRLRRDGDQKRASAKIFSTRSLRLRTTGQPDNADKWSGPDYTGDVSASEIINELPKLTEAERGAILDKLRELAQVDEDRWEQIINEPMPRPKLKAFIEQATAEGSEPLDLNRM